MSTLHEVYRPKPDTVVNPFFSFLSSFVIFIASNDFARVLLVFAIALL